METNQYGDLPQIHGMEDQVYYFWPADHGSHGSYYKQHIVDLEPSNDYSDDSDNGIVSLRPMQRFMHDQGPFYPHTLHVKRPLPSPLSEHYAQQWPVAEMTRNVSPDRTSASGLSSHASHCELQSPPACYTDLCSSGMEYSRYSYPATEPCYSGTYLPQAVVPHSVVNPRELEIEHQATEPEAACEEVEDNEDAMYEQESNYNPEPNKIGLDSTLTGKHFADSGIEHSVRDAESVQPLDFAEEPTSDSDYKPFNRSNKRKRSSGSNGVLGRVVKRRTPKRKDSIDVSSSSSTKKCRGTSNASRSATTAPTSIEDRRPFPCPLAPYGCDSNFVSKNEWKRHVSTQHIKIGFWRCDICAPTTDPKDENSLYHNDFNRMDLFRQHLRRMHARPKDKLSRSHVDYPVTDANLADHQTRCYHTLRTAPQHSSCLFCPKNFSGPLSWADRMDHVGSHLEKDRRHGPDMLQTAKWRTDPELEQYLLNEGLVKCQNGEWSISDGRPRRPSDTGSEEESEEE
ncbi:hypothetical protein T440DRAFT_468254 [Plenodomus tracheiphilus IPT5]|uniref:C2H2-type domain-containing protein n=1 Tax=Plenodomus tracheiphilus IPT5 TaxID=1408161 RepID=A0A6A7B5R5_9PLEO|nr:hypothetical protein T440DRAFT_468254 [Plenodomus tracheiphilus IPT5]